MKILKLSISTQFLMILLLSSCGVNGPSGIFRKLSPHEKYGQLLTHAGLTSTALGQAWFQAAESSLRTPLSISIPYKEQGYFPADKARAIALRFIARQGQKLNIELTKKPATDFDVYLDLWEEKDSNNRKLLAFADTNEITFNYEIDKEGTYLLRLQPELLKGGEYTLTISAGPSLAFPVKNGKAGSFWGADRDGGGRRHEGIDIFAPFRTPALAAAAGTVTRVGQNTLGGNVVFIRPAGRNYNLYYAHLDEQIAKEGDDVRAGDTLGLVGATGNARGGPPHLHFGIYTGDGAVDPWPFINPQTERAETVKAPESEISRSMKTASEQALHSGPAIKSAIIKKLPAEVLLEVIAASSTWYKVLLPDGKSGYVRSSSLSPANTTVRQIKIQATVPLLDSPHVLAARIKTLEPGASLRILGGYDAFYFVRSGDDAGWISKNDIKI